MTQIVEIIFVSFFLFWIIITVGVQFLTGFDKSWLVRKLDLFCLIPRWSFFAPNPGKTDCYILYRYSDSMGMTSSWKEMEIYDLRWYQFFWNPEKRIIKVLIDCINQIRVNSLDLKEGIMITLPYLTLLCFVSKEIKAMRQPFKIDSVQFLIMESDGIRKNVDGNIIFRSNFHRI